MNFPQALTLFFACLLLHLPEASAGNEIANHGALRQPSNIQLTLSKQAPASIHLEARQAPLAQILKEIARKTGAIIHYSVLPEEPVTATCAGINAGQIMDCLVGKQIGLVAHKPQKDKPAEFWLLGSSVGSCQAVTIAPYESPNPAEIEQQPTPEAQAEIEQANQDQSDKLIAQFKSAKDKAERAEALNNLISVGKIDDPNVRNALQDAMADKDDSIRAQALETLTNLDQDNLAEYVDKAMQDPSPEVRMAALNKASGQVDLLERAVADKDRAVSQFATSLLEALKKQ
jgi:hypothetical protein